MSSCWYIFTIWSVQHESVCMEEGSYNRLVMHSSSDWRSPSGFHYCVVERKQCSARFASAANQSSSSASPLSHLPSSFYWILLLIALLSSLLFLFGLSLMISTFSHTPGLFSFRLYSLFSALPLGLKVFLNMTLTGTLCVCFFNDLPYCPLRGSSLALSQQHVIEGFTPYP